MYQRNRNLFSFLAVLLTAGLITGVGSIFLLLSDQLGGAPRLVANNTGIDSTGIDSPAEAPPASPFEVLGTHDATVLTVAAAQNSPLVASGSYDNTVRLWNRNSQDAITLTHSGRVNDLAFTSTGTQLVTGSGAGELTLWSVASGKAAAVVQGQSGRISSLAVNGKEDMMASGSSKGALQVWSLMSADSKTGAIEPWETLVSVGPMINAIAFHPIDANILITGDQDGLLQIWDVAQQQQIMTLDDGADRIVSLAISNSGRYVASGSYDQTARVWDLETGELLQTLYGHDFVVADVAFSPDGTVLASSSYDESIKTWDWAKGQVLCTLEGHSGFVYSVGFSDSGNTLVSGGYDGTVRTWDLTAPVNSECLPQ
ncbi:MAG: WD40 repeat domain-containing protein [Cyanobacteria bacterium J06560_2]